MEKEKYYTPTIEEFYVGFEYERCDDGYKYFSDKFPGAIDIKLFYEFPNRFLPYFRVKYLDREDIESFGFSFETDYTIKLHFKKQVVHRGDEAIINVYYNCVNRWIMISLKRGDQFNTIFCGYIKNKSEFSRLLKQLSII